MDKGSLRKVYRQRRDALMNQPALFSKAGHFLAQNIHAFLEELPKGSLIFGYRAYRSEAPLPWVEGYRWSFPRIKGEGEMDFHEVSAGGGPESFVEGPWGILEPPHRQETLSLAHHAQAVLVPALAFDREGQRLGGGKGFYDRFLAPLKGVLKVGIGFQAQLHDGLLPKDPWDQGLDWLITEARVIGFSRRKEK